MSQKKWQEVLSDTIVSKMKVYPAKNRGITSSRIKRRFYQNSWAVSFYKFCARSNKATKFEKILWKQKGYC